MSDVHEKEIITYHIATIGPPLLETLTILSSEEKNFALHYEHIIIQYACSPPVLQRELAQELC